MEGIRPDTVLIPSSFGFYATPIITEKGWVSQTLLLPLKYSWTDQLTGAMQSHAVKAKVYKA
jgi:hypothetical protein